MTTLRNILLSLAIVTAVTLSTSADDLGLVSISNSREAQVAEDIFETAYARTGNSFLVSVDGSDLAKLRQAGLDYEPLLKDASIGELYFVLGPDHPDAPKTVDLGRFGKPVILDNGLQIVPLGRQTAASIAETGELKVVPVQDWQVRFLFKPAVSTVALLEGFPTDSLVSRVNQDSIYTFTKRLEDFQTRYIWTDSINAARDWIVQTFLDWGYTDVTTPSFVYGGSNHYNIKVVKPGYAEPDAVIVVGGHYDSWVGEEEPGVMVYAPGADDDGSGVVVTMELARILADVPLRKTIIFMPFNAEEVGLVGSRAAAMEFAAQQTKLEVMYNFDMVGNTSDSFWDIDLSSGSNDVYLKLTRASAIRVTGLAPVIVGMGSGSDHVSFNQQGFDIVNTIESDFSPYWHQNSDVVANMDFPYLKDVTKMTVASVAAVADGTYPVAVDGIVDIGDGQSLEVYWSDCAGDVSYWVFWGTSPGNYTDSVLVPPGECSVVVENLSEGVLYFFLAIGEAPTGYRALYGVEGWERSLPAPRAPSNFLGSADLMQISLSWTPNQERDFSHYNVYRRIGSILGFDLFRAGYTETSLVDTEVAAQVSYTYYITAVDYDGYESPASAEISLYPASFDGGILLVDEFTTENASMPDQPEQEAYFDSIFGETGITLEVADGYGDYVSTGDIGRFSSLFWIDDDFVRKSIDNSEDVLSWFATYITNLFVAGFRTIQRWSSNPIPMDHLLYREFQLAGYTYWGRPDFVGAHGQGGWPSLQKDSTRGPLAFVDIPRLTPRPGATVIYTYDSSEDFPETEGQICGLAYDGPKGKRILLSFPIWYLTTESATSLMAKVVAYFGDSGQQFDKGDLDNSGTIDIFDVTILIYHLFLNLEPLAHPEAADMDSYPGLDIGDLTYLIRYLFLGGPSPAPSYSG